MYRPVQAERLAPRLSVAGYIGQQKFPPVIPAKRRESAALSRDLTQGKRVRQFPDSLGEGLGFRDDG